MGKLLSLIVIILIQVSSVNTVVQGSNVNCTTQSNGNSIVCIGCGVSNYIQDLFQFTTSPFCAVKDCNIDPGTNLNGWMCKSCSDSGTKFYSAGKKLFQRGICVAYCDVNYIADSNQICQPITATTPLTGSEVNCTEASLINFLCTGCGANNYIQNLFIRTMDGSCAVRDCKFNPGSNLNNWMCQSCNGLPGVHPIYSGPLFQGNTCVSACNTGFTPDTNQICQPNPVRGTDVACGTSSPTGISSDCNRCANGTDSNLFIPSISSYCKFLNCKDNISTFLSGWMCKSCNKTAGANKIYSGSFLQGNACVASCSTGFTVDSNQICQPSPLSGYDVPCGTPSSTGISSDCNTCVINAITSSIFQPSTSPGCKVVNCSEPPGTHLNGWMCKSCNGIPNAHSIYSTGKFFQGNACVAYCNTDFTADSNQICQPIYAGTDVACGRVSTGNNNNCQGCGDNSIAYSLFTYSSETSSCKVTNCSANPYNNLNGWMCSSCHGVINAHPAYSAGRVLQGTNCVSSCLLGYTADANQICQQTAIPGSDVACGNVSKTSIYSTNCQGCGVNSNIQNLFTVSINSNCKVVDCSKNPGPSLNGWMCKSCKGITGAHSAYSAGKLLFGNVCVPFCPSGQTADANNACRPGSNSSSIQLTSVFSMLFLYLLS